jgi:hypothetical protein
VVELGLSVVELVETSSVVELDLSVVELVETVPHPRALLDHHREAADASLTAVTGSRGG